MAEAKKDEPIFPGGPPQSKLDEWKAQYGSVYMTEFDDEAGGEVFIWRTLSRLEYKEILKTQNADAFYREERVCERCVLWPENYNFQLMADGKAGIPSVLAEQIMDRSGFTPRAGPVKL